MFDWIIPTAGALGGVGLLSWRLGAEPKTFGSANWLKPWSAYHKGYFKSSAGAPIGDWTGQLAIRRNGTHGLIIGPAGSSKGTAAIIPRLLSDRFLIVNDPGGENTAVASKHWRKKGYVFYCLNPWGLHQEKPWRLPNHGFNPMTLLLPGGFSYVSDAKLLAQMIITQSVDESGNSKFFRDGARIICAVLIMHCMEFEPPHRRHLGTVREYITSPPDEWEQLLENMQRSATREVARQGFDLARREAQAGPEFSGVFSTLVQETDWIDDPVMQSALKVSDINLYDLKSDVDGAALSVCVPLEYMKTHAAYVRLVIGSALRVLQQVPIARNDVTFVIDEAASLGRMDMIKDGLATFRKYRIRLWPVFQNVGQIKELYGRSWETFVANADVRQFLGANDLETAQYISRLCGEATIKTKTRGAGGGYSQSDARRALLTPDEVLYGHPKKQFVLIDKSKPLLLKRTPYWERPEFSGAFARNPFHGRTPWPGLSMPFQLCWGGLMKCLLAIIAPDVRLAAIVLALAGLIIASRYYYPPAESPVSETQIEEQAGNEVLEQQECESGGSGEPVSSWSLGRC